MKIRGERECTDCGTHWSYYETGAVACPACGSLRSVGLDDRTRHTDLRVSLDLTPVRDAVDEVSLDELAGRASERCREYVTRRGFVVGGELRDLDDAYLAAAELRHVADVVARARHVDERTELYFLALLGDADAGNRPAIDEVPGELRPARGTAVATAIEEYRREIRRWREERGFDAAERAAFDALGENVTRLRLLDGDAPRTTIRGLVRATRDLADGLRGDAEASHRARAALDDLAFDVE